jgi:hypothetical protein
VIVVIGRPGLGASGQLDRLSARIAWAAVMAGGQVEMVGSVGDDAEGDDVMVALGRAGIGHAAILRDPAAATPAASDSDGADEDSRLPRFDAGDVDLGLRYLPECRVLVVAEPLPDDALDVVADAAAYHGAQLIVIGEGHGLPETATIVEAPREGSGAAFAEVVARYAVALDDGRGAADAWRDAVDQTGWEQASE